MFRIFKSIIKSISKGIYTDPEVQKFFARHPRLFSFLKKRLTPDEKFGLYLTIGFVFAAYFIYLFFGVVLDTIGQQPLIQADLRIINLVQIFRSPLFNQAMLYITYLGNGQMVFLTLFLAGIILVIYKRWYYLITLLVSVIGGEAFIWIVKMLLKRPRPDLANALIYEKSYSFPSGHAFIAFALYGLLAYYIFHKVKGRIYKALIIAFYILLVLAIGFSRVYLGVHWASDVLASYAGGAAWLTILVTNLEIRRKFKFAQPSTPFLGKKSIVAVSIIFALIWLSYSVFFLKTHPVITQAKQAESQIILSESDIPNNLFANLPRTSEDITGKPMEPINIIIISAQKDLDNAFVSAGWELNDKISSRNIWHMSFTTILNKAYPTAPGIPSFWNKMPNDFAFEKPTAENSVRERHHIHFWETPFVLSDGRKVWFATAHYDQSIKISSSLFIPAHTIDPAIDKEREKVKVDIQNTGLMQKIQEFQIVEPTLGNNQTGDQFFTDGKAEVIYLQ